MHITMVNNYLYLRGGSERVMFEEAELLRERQVTVSFFSRRHAQNIPTEYDERFPPFVDPASLPLGAQLRQIPQVIYNRQTYRLFAQFLQQVQPQLLHAHNIYGGLTSAVCDAAQHQGIPMVMTLHDYKLLCPAYLMLTEKKVCGACQQGAYLHCAFNRCHKDNAASSLIYALESYLTRWGKKYDPLRCFICPSEALRQKMIAAGFRPERVVYLPNAVAVQRYEPCYAPGDYLLYVGRLSPEKGVMTLLSAIRDLGVHLAIVGAGPLRAELEAFVQQHDMAQRVTFHGYQSGAELKRLFQHAAFVVLPSECVENAPMTVLEAFAYGKPVVGARMGGIPEMIEHGKTGLLVAPGDIEGWRSAIETLWNSRQTLPAMGRAAHQVVATRFSLQQHADNLLALYQRALAG